MNRLIIVITAFCAIHIQAFGQSVEYEQKTFDYFFNKVFKQEFPRTDKIQFTGYTESELSRFGFVKSCFDPEIGNALEKAAEGVSKPKKKLGLDQANKVGLEFKNKQVKSRLTLYVLQANRIKDFDYVLIEVHEKDRNTFMFFFELDHNGEVLRWCKTGMIH